MIKVLCVTWQFVQEGGVTGLILNYFRHIDASRIQMDFLVISEDSPKKILEEIQSRNSKVYCVPIFAEKSIFRLWEALRRFFRGHENEYQIVHSHLYQLDWLLFCFAKKYGARICISHAHVTKWADYRLRAIRNRIMAMPVRYCADVWGACSAAAGEFLYGKDFLQSPRHWIMHNAIEVKRFAFNEDGRNKARKELGYTDEIVLGHVGRLVPVKNQIFLLEILKVLVEQGCEKYRLLIVGDGELRNNLTEKAERLGVSDFVTFAGTRTDIPEMLWAMDVFLLPSFSEGLPVSGIEAQAAGLSCLFSDQITKEAGIVNTTYLPIDKGPDVWRKKIMKLVMDINIRKEAAQKMVAAGYDIDSEARVLVQRYTEMVKEENK